MNALPCLGLLTLALSLAASWWGPGNHLEFAHRVYRSRRRTLPKKVAQLLFEQREAYLYGNVAADIVNFKAWGGHYNHCHRWTIVAEMQELGETRAEQAFCLGYLSHLAADTIAHNHFVPYHLARYARSKGLGHLYWEMRADRFVPEERWKVVTKLKENKELDALDDLVNRTVPKKALSMRTNKLVFNHLLLIAERDRWRRGVDRLHGMAWAPLEEKFLERFRRAAVARVRLALSGGLDALTHLDTNGKDAQREAWKARKRNLSRFRKKRRAEESAAFAARYLEGMESPPPSSGTPHW